MSKAMGRIRDMPAIDQAQADRQADSAAAGRLPQDPMAGH
jgi:hypothetical protein